MKRFAFIVVFVLGSSAAARAYSVQSPITHACHESITVDALRAARAATGRLQAPTADRDQAALIADLPYTLPDDMRDFAAAALVLAVVDNDLKGYSPTDELALVPITADPALQREHCLRTADEDEPDGSARALADCAQSMHERVAAALAGLGPDGDVDLDAHMTLLVDLAFRGARTAVSLPIYYVRMGQALHTMEDSFAHSYRSADQLAPTVMLNWVDQQAQALTESRDGPGHSLALDRCDDPDPLRTTRRQLATRAATELILATLDSTATAADKLAAADAVIARYTTLQAGCDFANGWCDAPEAKLANSIGCGCALGGGGASGGGRWALVAAALLALTWRRRGARALGLGLLLVAATASPARAARSADPAADPTDVPAAPPTDATAASPTGATAASPTGAKAAPPDATAAPPTGAKAASSPGAKAAPAGGATAPASGATAPASDGKATATAGAPAGAPAAGADVEPGRQTATPTRGQIADARAHKRLGPRVGAQLTLGGAVDRAGAAVALGLRVRLTERWQVGLDAEYNPFFSVDGHEARSGALNVYVVGVRRYPMLWSRVNLRTTAEAGFSTLLFDLYGAPSGSTGPFVGVSLLGLDVDLGHALRLVVDPAHIALPVPHISGQPFFYLQYRFTVAIAFGG